MASRTLVIYATILLDQNVAVGLTSACNLNWDHQKQNLFQSYDCFELDSRTGSSQK